MQVSLIHTDWCIASGKEITKERLNYHHLPDSQAGERLDKSSWILDYPTLPVQRFTDRLVKEEKGDSGSASRFQPHA